jgi:hypothetical protein
MEKTEFVDLLKELSDFYERKEPKTSTIDLWYRLVQRIPSEPVKWITKKIEEVYEAFPRNLTAALWSSYTQWQQSYPEKKAKKVYFDCPDCNEGLIFAKKKNAPHVSEFVFRCSRCRQDNTRAYPLSSRLELLEEYDVMPKEGNLKSSNKNLNDLVKKVGHAISEPRPDISSPPF